MRTNVNTSQRFDWHLVRWLFATIGLLAGCSLIVLPVFVPAPPDAVGLDGMASAGDSAKILATAGVAVIMATLWITEVIPLAATSLLPVALIPLLGIQSGGEVAQEYMNPTIFLYIGGFLVAIAMQRWDLHRRIALKMLLLIGSTPDRLMIGFMLTTGVLSMFVSNTATTMMMVTIAVSVLATLCKTNAPENAKLSIGLLLAIAYSASIGGVATLVGTPPNLTLVAIYGATFPEAQPLNFVGWMFFAVPISTLLMVCAWGLLKFLWVPRDLPGIPPSELREQYDALGCWDRPQLSVLTLFTTLVVAWITRSNLSIGSVEFYGWSQLLPEPGYVSDGTVAIAIASLLFFIPTGNKPGERLLEADAFGEIPWSIVMLFGGGFALASAFMESGLSNWLASQLQLLSHVHPLLLLLVICLALSFLTELTSNAATTATVLPILAALSVSIGCDPLYLMIPATITCSFAFMLPVATPPNAIVFGTGKVEISQMMRSGIALNLLAVFIVVLAASIWQAIGWLPT